MAAHLDLSYLRQYALPDHAVFSRNFPTSHSAADQFRLGGVDRPQLHAIWHVGACGRPICMWSIDPGDPNVT